MAGDLGEVVSAFTGAMEEEEQGPAVGGLGGGLIALGQEEEITKGGLPLEGDLEVLRMLSGRGGEGGVAKGAATCGEGEDGSETGSDRWIRRSRESRVHVEGGRLAPVGADHNPLPGPDASPSGG
jgi:hypothetical protein